MRIRYIDQSKFLPRRAWDKHSVQSPRNLERTPWAMHALNADLCATNFTMPFCRTHGVRNAADVILPHRPTHGPLRTKNLFTARFEPTHRICRKETYSISNSLAAQIPFMATAADPWRMHSHLRISAPITDAKRPEKVLSMPKTQKAYQFNVIYALHVTACPKTVQRSSPNA